MIRRWRLLSSFFLSATVAVYAQSTSTEPEKIPLQIYVTAIGKGVPSPSELSVYMDALPSQVVSLRPAKDDKLLFAVLIDSSTSEHFNAYKIRQAAAQLFQTLLTGENRGYLVVFNGQVLISKTPAQNISQVRPLLDKLQFGGATALYDAIEQTCHGPLRRASNLDNPRRVILLLSDGQDIHHTTPAKAIEAAQIEGVTIYATNLDERTNRLISGSQGEEILDKLAQSTGGKFITGRSAADEVDAIIASIQNQWALSLIPAPPSNDQLHSLKVRDTDSKVHLAAPARVSGQ